MLIWPHELHKLISSHSAVILDCRFTLTDTEWGKAEYAKGHIPGAHYAHLDQDLSAPVTPGRTGRHPLPKRDELAKLLGKWCVQPGSTVVAYDQSTGGIAARAWWLLKWAGVEDVRLLDGGWANWRRNRLPESDDQPELCEELFNIGIDSMPVIEMDKVQLLVQGDASLLIDARAAERYRGANEPIDPIAGHIPGAINIPWMTNIGEEGVWSTKEEIRRRFEDMNVPAGGNVAVYCGSGVTACHLAFAYEYAEMGKAKLYPGSWSEWITRPDNPIIKE